MPNLKLPLSIQKNIYSSSSVPIFHSFRTFWRQLMKPKNLIFLIWRFPGKHHPDFHRVEHEPVLQQQGQDGGNRPVRTGQWIIPFFQRNPPLIRERERKRPVVRFLSDGQFFQILGKNGCLEKLFLRFFSPDSFSSQMFRFFIKLNVMRNRWS